MVARNWSSKLRAIHGNKCTAPSKGAQDYSSFSSLQAVFVPIVPLFEEMEAEADEETSLGAASAISGSAGGAEGAAEDGNTGTNAIEDGGMVTLGSKNSLVMSGISNTQTEFRDD